MENTWKYRVVESNNYDIPKRLKEIDPGYVVLLNRLKGKFELHNENNHNTYCLTIGEELDSRAIDKINQLNRQNNERLVREIEEHNAKLDRAKEEKMADDMNEMSKDIYKFTQKGEIERKIDYKGGTF